MWFDADQLKAFSRLASQQIYWDDDDDENLCVHLDWI